ncbi:AraC family transcriptional regulator [Bacillus sonorensis]|nr:AraC family transcriptional regulator [Bacillus sonorensis]
MQKKAAQALDVSPVVARAREYMQKHFAERSFSLKQTADALQVSPVYLSRMMKRELGVTFIQLLTEMRMQKAVHLLKTTALPIHDIAEQTGYDTQHYFSTVFKKRWEHHRISTAACRQLNGQVENCNVSALKKSDFYKNS